MDSAKQNCCHWSVQILACPSNVHRSQPAINFVQPVVFSGNRHGAAMTLTLFDFTAAGEAHFILQLFFPALLIPSYCWQRNWNACRTKHKCTHREYNVGLMVKAATVTAVFGIFSGRGGWSIGQHRQHQFLPFPQGCALNTESSRLGHETDHPTRTPA